MMFYVPMLHISSCLLSYKILYVKKKLSLDICDKPQILASLTRYITDLTEYPNKILHL